MKKVGVASASPGATSRRVPLRALTRLPHSGFGGQNSTNFEVSEPKATVGHQGAPCSYLERPFPAGLRQMTVSVVAFNFLTFVPLSGFATSPHSDQS